MLEKLPPALGHWLEGQRAGIENILFNRIDLRDGTAKITVTSPAFVDHASIPPQYTADGEGLSPEIDWNGVPPAATSLALIVEDADSPTAAPLVHAIAVDIDPGRNEIKEGELQDATNERNSSVSLGRNSWLRRAWLPPDPPPGHGVHRYAFQVFAFAAGGSFQDAPGRNELLEALRTRAIASGCLIGTYARDNRINARTEKASAESVIAGVPATE